jgi:hypothetical protein
MHDATGLSVRAAWRAEGIEETRLEPQGEFWPAGQQDAGEWVGPVIFVGGSLLSQNPTLVSVALGVVANNATEILRGRPLGRQTASLTVAVETKMARRDESTTPVPPTGSRSSPT